MTQPLFRDRREAGRVLGELLMRYRGHPEELVMGAIASGGVVVPNDDVVRLLAVTPGTIQHAAEQEGRELRRGEQRYREDRPAVDVTGRTVILVDDGLATGASIRAAIEALRQGK